MGKVLKFRKNPSDIEAVEFDGGDISMHGVSIRHTAEGAEVYNGEHDSWIKVSLGDFIRIDIEKDNYPIAAMYMSQNYTVINDG